MLSNMKIRTKLICGALATILVLVLASLYIFIMNNDVIRLADEMENVDLVMIVVSGHTKTYASDMAGSMELYNLTGEKKVS